MEEVSILFSGCSNGGVAIVKHSLEVGQQCTADSGGNGNGEEVPLQIK